MAPGGRASALSLPQILNECQKSTSTDFQRKCARMLADRRREEPVELVEELLGATRHAFVVGKVRAAARGVLCACRRRVAAPACSRAGAPAQREPAVERLIKFVCALATEREPGVDGAEDDVFLEELLSALLPLAGAADKAVRFRVCQLVASLLDGLSADTELTDQLYEQLGATMTEHLRDRAPSVRMQAARALARLQARASAAAFRSPAACRLLTQLALRAADRTRARRVTSRRTPRRRRCCRCWSATRTRTCGAQSSPPWACRVRLFLRWCSARATTRTRSAAPRF